jgi:hypothetical protein
MSHKEGLTMYIISLLLFLGYIIVVIVNKTATSQIMIGMYSIQFLYIAIMPFVAIVLSFVYWQWMKKYD